MRRCILRSKMHTRTILMEKTLQFRYILMVFLILLCFLTLLIDSLCRPPLLGHETYQGLDWCWSQACYSRMYCPGSQEQWCRWWHWGRHSYKFWRACQAWHTATTEDHPGNYKWTCFTAGIPEYFHQKFATFINQCLPMYLDCNPNSWVNISFPETFQVCFAKIN